MEEVVRIHCRRPYGVKDITATIFENAICHTGTKRTLPKNNERNDNSLKDYVTSVS